MIYRPAGPGLSPAIVVMHGSGGVSLRTSAWGDREVDVPLLILIGDEVLRYATARGLPRARRQN